MLFDSTSEKPNPREMAASLRELPPPDGAAQAHSERLIEHIRAEMAAAGGRLSFARFMELALYAPGLGYYSAGSAKLGEAGDFITAPELSPLFSRCLARQSAEVLAVLGGGDLLEFGAGTGVMAADILAELERLECLPERYLILELSADLRQRQRTTLAQRLPHLVGRVEWLEGLPEAGFRGVVLANEVLDAMPVHRFCIQQGKAKELFVTWAEERFSFEADTIAGRELQAALDTLLGTTTLPEGYASEINLRAREWVHSIAAVLERGTALLVDYGFPRHEYYHLERHHGTLMCHYRHRAHSDALILPGLQDITAHVDFTAVADAALEAGLQVAGFASQANFLIANGLLELAAETEGDQQAQLEAAAQVKRLTMPGEMGELFKVMALSRGLDFGLRGFALRDERGRL